MRKTLLVVGIALVCLSAYAQRFIKVINSIEALVAANPNDIYTNVFVVDVGEFYTWNSASTDPTNANLSVLKATSQSTGRWFLHSAGGNAGVTNIFEITVVTNLFVENSYFSNIFVTNLTVFSTNTFITNFYFNNTYITNISQGDNWVAEGTSNSTLSGIGKTWKLVATNSVESGQAGETGVIDFSSTNGTYTIAFSLLSDGTLTVTNNGVLVDTLALNSLYGGGGTRVKTDDGTYKELTSPPGATVTNININPTDNYYAVRSNSTTFNDGALYSVNTTNFATDAQFVWGPGTTNVLFRSGQNLIYTNGGTSTYLAQLIGSGVSALFGLDTSGSAHVLADSGRVVRIGVTNSGNIFWDGLHLSPNTTEAFDVGAIDTGGAKWRNLVGQNLYTHGTDDGAGNKTRLHQSFAATTNGAIYNVEAAGTGVYRRHTFQIGGTNVFTIEPNNGWSGAGTKDFADDGTFKIRTNYITVALSNPNSAVTTGNTNFWVAPEAVTIKTVTAHLLVPSSSGSVTLELKKNGTTVLSAPVSLTSGTTNATASVSVTAVSALDRLAGEITAAGTTAYGAQLKIGYTTP